MTKLIINTKEKLNIQEATILVDNIYKYNMNKSVSVCIPNTFLKSNKFQGVQYYESLDEIKEYNLNYALINHSEYNEETTKVKQKIKDIQNTNTIPVIFVGERTANENAIKEVNNILNRILTNNLDKIIIVYEPIWSIGTDKIPDLKHVQIIKNVIKTSLDNYNVNNYEIYYGGSVDNKLIKTFNDTFDGYVVCRNGLTIESITNLLDN